MDITQTLVKKVKKHNKIKWHDEKWHNFQDKPEVEAINYALSNRSFDDTDADIVIEAKKYLNKTMSGKPKKKTARRRPATKKAAKRRAVKPKTKKIHTDEQQILIFNGKRGSGMRKAKKHSRKMHGTSKRRVGFSKKIDVVSGLTAAGTGAAGAIMAAVAANYIPVKDARIKAALPVVAGLALAGSKNRMIQQAAAGMAIAGILSLVRQLVPSVPMLAGEPVGLLGADEIVTPEIQREILALEGIDDDNDSLLGIPGSIAGNYVTEQDL